MVGDTEPTRFTLREEHTTNSRPTEDNRMNTEEPTTNWQAPQKGTERVGETTNKTRTANDRTHRIASSWRAVLSSLASSQALGPKLTSRRRKGIAPYLHVRTSGRFCNNNKSPSASSFLQLSFFYFPRSSLDSSSSSSFFHSCE